MHFLFHSRTLELYIYKIQTIQVLWIMWKSSEYRVQNIQLSCCACCCCCCISIGVGSICKSVTIHDIGWRFSIENEKYDWCFCSFFIILNSFRKCGSCGDGRFLLWLSINGWSTKGLAKTRLFPKKCKARLIDLALWIYSFIYSITFILKLRRNDRNTGRW